MTQNKINIIQGDITTIQVDAIVNAANTSLLGGGGVDGAIHRAGGKSILEECRQIRAKQGGCNVGDAVITGAGNLPARYVIHTVGPRWNGGSSNEPELLKKAYLSCFNIVEQYNIETVSFPNISTGIYRFPKKLAAEIALSAIHSSLSRNQNILHVNLVCFDDENYEIYRSLNQ
ncbi:O-acetyl-ADP-ribose deacetylase [Xenorhabdus sp. 12]|uniref:O-acetyl-ADP-ribose deacetylase n=1 Tax=Xenorhabdus santafensis TaxID=2582833 RepID=A0ABU4S3Y3_9GAMM|nr:O-acetyl-ADP-ribose deacetylase [Xenorhabdus sp. 12]MDX7985909.1 O-acetyl-ADP-ribose deacetylase [Xenorhabdus sp. 12]